MDSISMYMKEETNKYNYRSIMYHWFVICVSVSACVRACLCACARMCVFVYVHVGTYVCMYVYIYICACVRMWVLACVRVCMWVYIYICVLCIWEWPNPTNSFPLNQGRYLHGICVRILLLDVYPLKWHRSWLLRVKILFKKWLIRI